MPSGLSFGSFGTVINERKGFLMRLDTSAFTTARAVTAAVDFKPEIAAWSCIAPLAAILDGGDTDA